MVMSAQAVVALIAGMDLTTLRCPNAGARRRAIEDAIRLADEVLEYDLSGLGREAYEAPAPVKPRICRATQS